MKLGCDGNSPCKTCRQKGIGCNFSRLQSKNNSLQQEGTGTLLAPSLAGRDDKTNIIFTAISKPVQENNPVSDRGSIKFLLNSGTASFIECFRFPSSKERRNIYNFINSTDFNDASILDCFAIDSENGSTFSDPFEDEPIDWSLFEDENLLRFLSSPLNEIQGQADNMYAPLFMDPTFATPVNSLPFQGEYEPINVQSAGLVQIILDQAISLQTSPQEQADISYHLNYLFTPSKISKLVSLYFEFWHPHCPILHQPSFNIEMIPPVQLLSITLMGAMYSQVDQDVSTAKRILDISELVVFSMPDLTDEFEIRQMLRAAPGTPLDQSVKTTPLVYSYLFAAYLMVVVQFWAGNMVSRKRAIETRFGVVVKVLHLGLGLYSGF
jgi:hypothetical protein